MKYLKTFNENQSNVALYADTQTIPFWRTKESEGAESIYYGKTVGDIEEGLQGDLILTQKGDIYKFVHGSKNTTKQPYLEFIKKIKVPHFPIDDNIVIDEKTWQPLGNAEIFKLQNGKYLWEY